MSTCYFPSSKGDSQRGATFVEFVIVFPVLIMFLLAFFDVARYWQTYSAASYAAHYGIEQAVIAPNLELAQTTGQYTAAKQKLVGSVREKAFAAITSAGNSEILTQDPEIIVPLTADDMKITPIEVRVHGKYTPLFSVLGIDDINFTVSSFGYREPKRYQAMPVPVDCWGTPMDLSESGVQIGLGCPCDKGPLSFTKDGECVCSDVWDYLYSTLYPNHAPLASLQPDGTCGCDPGLVPILPFDDGTITDQRLRDSLNSMGAVCCPPETIQPCPTGLIREPGGCGCICASGGVLDPQTNTCSCSDTNKVYGTSGCACKPDGDGVDELAECIGGTSRDPDDCLCKCPYGTLEGGGSSGCSGSPGSGSNQTSCTCPGDKEFIDGTCKCKSEIVCGPGQALNPSTCNCDCPQGQTAQGPGGLYCCPTGLTYDVGTGQCACSNPVKQFVDGACKCTNEKPEDALPTMVRNSSCQWVCPNSGSVVGPPGSEICCPAGSTYSGGTCACTDSNKQFNGSSCKCKSSLSPCGSGMVRNSQTCECECAEGASSNGPSTCACDNPNHIIDSGACQCPSCPWGSALNGATCECTCDSITREWITIGSGVKVCSPLNLCKATGCNFNPDGSCVCVE